jgi:hypothetical protein
VDTAPKASDCVLGGARIFSAVPEDLLEETGKAEAAKLSGRNYPEAVPNGESRNGDNAWKRGPEVMAQAEATGESETSRPFSPAVS